MSESPDYSIVDNVLFSHGTEKIAELPATARFAHYTSTDAAVAMIGSPPEDRSIWLRCATEMNDFSEVEYGQQCLAAALSKTVVRAGLEAALASINETIFPHLMEMLRADIRALKKDTYLLSLAQHEGEELDCGLLSMWRAYGGPNNVCLILNPQPFITDQDAYGAFIAPVFYGGSEGFEADISKITEKIIENASDLSRFSPDMLAYNLKLALDGGVLSTKHPGFKEEREWRIIYRPSAEEGEPSIPSKVVNVGGALQRVHYLPMQNVPEKGLHGASLEELLERIIIGPTHNPDLVVEAFVQMLSEAGVSNAAHRVTACNIPLRR